MVRGKALTRWYFDQIKARPIQTCADCGKEGPAAYIQPQHPDNGFPLINGLPQAICTDCHNRRVYQYQADRKAELSAMPRCEVTRCKHRGAFTVMSVLLCGKHKTKVVKKDRASRGNDIFGLLYCPAYSREDILKMANGH